MASQGGEGGGAGWRKYPQASGMSSEAAFAAVWSRLTTSFENLGARTALSFRWRTITNVLLLIFNFTGVMDPTRSWAARWLRIGRFVPGCYTLAVSVALPHDLQNISEEEHVLYVPPKRVGLAS